MAERDLLILRNPLRFNFKGESLLLHIIADDELYGQAARRVRRGMGNPGFRSPTLRDVFGAWTQIRPDSKLIRITLRSGSRDNSLH